MQPGRLCWIWTRMPAWRTILEGTATETGERFFYVLVENLAKALTPTAPW